MHSRTLLNIWKLIIGWLVLTKYTSCLWDKCKAGWDTMKIVFSSQVSEVSLHKSKAVHYAWKMLSGIRYQLGLGWITAYHGILKPHRYDFQHRHSNFNRTDMAMWRLRWCVVVYAFNVGSQLRVKQPDYIFTTTTHFTFPGVEEKHTGALLCSREAAAFIRWQVVTCSVHFTAKLTTSLLTFSLLRCIHSRSLEWLG